MSQAHDPTSDESSYLQEESAKINAFCAAMHKYENQRIYQNLKLLVSCSVIILQAVTLWSLITHYNGTSFLTITLFFLIAFILTDFINGMVHMFMDNNTGYHSIIGPFVSSFHLHHYNVLYKKQGVLSIYFFESGTKFWLLGYLLIVAIIQKTCTLHYGLNVGLVAFGILSSLAEVSHFWCHNSNNAVIKHLQHAGILLSKKHHIHHHLTDNTHYAFLNGMTDPLLNLISRYFYAGYKNNADKHTSAYIKSIQKIK